MGSSALSTQATECIILPFPWSFRTLSCLGIRLSVDDGDKSVMSIIGVYLACLDQGLDCYKEHLVELEIVVSESELWV